METKLINKLRTIANFLKISGLGKLAATFDLIIDEWHEICSLNVREFLELSDAIDRNFTIALFETLEGEFSTIHEQYLIEAMDFERDPIFEGD